MTAGLRSPLGVVDVGPDASLAEAVAAGAGWRPLLALGGLAGGLLAQGIGLLFAAEIAASLGEESAGIGHLLGLWSIGVLLGIPFALRAVRSRARVVTGAAGGSLAACGVVVVAMATTNGWVAAGAIVAGLGSTLCCATHRGLLSDLYPPRALAHALALYRAIALLVAALGLLLADPVASALGLSWRAGLLAAAGILGVAAGVCGTLQEPAVGGFESSFAQRAAGGPVDVEPPRSPSFAELVRRLLAIPSVRPVMAVYAISATLGFGIVLYGGYAVVQRAELPPDVLPGVLVTTAVIAAAVVIERAAAFARGARRHPRELGRAGAVAFALSGAGLAVVGIVTWPPALLAGLVLAGAALAAGVAALDRLMLLVVPTSLRGAAGAVGCGYEGVLGVLLGGALLSALEASRGLDVALPVLGAVALVAAAVLRGLGPAAERDLDASASALREAAQFTSDRARGVQPPLLSCRGIDFSYGPLQILFGVDFTVDEGEMVALLGTNGAGKSTLLRVIAGLGTPSSGTVRLRGEDITFAEPGDRVRLGLSQIPGGKAVFGPLSVVENLRLYGYALGRDRKAVDRGIEEAFATFPRLHERRHSPAATMSGGEQQMLALSKALILQPRLLLIDELSLGLAPKVVGELLELVRSINDKGTAVVLVEQSVNVALSLADHAYFMEKGQIRFDGPAADLLERPDIVRSVFLAGASGVTP